MLEDERDGVIVPEGGAMDAERVTVPAKPFRLVTVIRHELLVAPMSVIKVAGLASTA
jgi:hypothetical protein